MVGISLHRIVRAIGYPVPALTESGPLPRGLSFTDHGNGTAVIAGTPAKDSCGRHRVTITATNTSGTATRHFTIVVSQRCRAMMATLATAGRKIDWDGRSVP
jgi:hypothetical protein